MNFNEIKQAASKKAPDYLRDTVYFEEALKYLKQLILTAHNKDEEALADEVVAVAFALSYNNLQSFDEVDLVRIDYLIDMIEPIVKESRLAIFNKEVNPFDNIVDAGKWIYAESKSPIPEAMKEKAGKFQKYRDDFMNSILKGEIWGCGSEVEFKELTVTLPGIKKENEGWTETVPVKWSKKLLVLARAVDRISKMTDFEKYAITAHILTGLKPVLPRYRIETPSNISIKSPGEWFIRNQVVIKINAMDISFEELHKIYKKFRDMLGYTGKKSIRKKQMVIYSMVQKEGGVPDKCKKKFWVKMQTRWNEENPDDKYTRWEGIYKAYNNIAAKISIGQLSDD